jgi:superoxide reductase
MTGINELFQEADWKTEKHAPVIDAPDTFKKGEFTQITVSVGKQVEHPNKTEHHIRWISVYFLPKGEKFPSQIAKAEFTAHGESIKGPDTSTVFTKPVIDVTFKTDKPGTIYASSYCNIHGLWQSLKEVKIQ